MRYAYTTYLVVIIYKPGLLSTDFFIFLTRCYGRGCGKTWCGKEVELSSIFDGK